VPELPDVENLRCYFDATALHKRIERVKVRDARLLETSASKVHSVLEGRRFTETARRGKRLFARACDDGGGGATKDVDRDGCEWLALHFGMTGSLEFFEVTGARPRGTALEIGFEDGGTLAVTTTRRLGKIGVARSPQQYAREHGLGPDALEVGRDEFVETIGRRRGSVKAALMNQSAIAGIGNIYADEVLFQAGVHPETPAAEVDRATLAELWRVMRRVLRTASDRAADADEMPRGWLLHARNHGADCPRCDGSVEKLSVSGRPTYICPACQHKRGGER